MIHFFTFGFCAIKLGTAKCTIRRVQDSTPLQSYGQKDFRKLKKIQYGDWRYLLCRRLDNHAGWGSRAGRAARSPQNVSTFLDNALESNHLHYV